MNRQRVWLTWERQRRNRELADAFGAVLGEFDHSKLPRLIRYVASVFVTLVFLLRHRPAVVFSQCPSVVLAAFTAALKRVFGYRLVLDAHNIAVEDLNSANSFLRRLHRYAFRAADLVTVSNDFLREDVAPFSQKVCALPDRLPSIRRSSTGRSTPEESRLRVTLISTFAPDEPIEAVLDAVDAFPHPILLSVTGKKEKALTLLHRQNERILFTGFLPDEDFERLLADSDLIIDLTTLPNCLVCGAYEALSVAVPCMVTDSPSNRQVFAEGFLYVENTARSIQAGLEDFVANDHSYRRAVGAYRERFSQHWNESFRHVDSAVSALESVSPPSPCSDLTGLDSATARVRRGILFMAGSTAVWQVASWVLTLLTARYLAPADYGLLALAETINPYLLMVATLRIDAWLLQRKALATRDEESIFALLLLLGVGTMLFGIAAAPIVAHFYRSDQMALPFQLISSVFLFRSLQLIPDARLRRELEFKQLALMNVTLGVSRGILQVVLAAMGFSYWSLVIGNIYGELGITLWLIALRGLPRRLAWDWSVNREAVRFGLAATGAGVFGIIFTTSDNAVVGRLFGIEVLGFYAFAYYLMELPLSKLNTVLGPVVQPYFAKVRESVPELRRAFLNLTRGILFAVFPALLGLFVVAEDFVPVIFGEQWRPMVPILQVFCFVGVLRAFGANVSALLFSINRPNTVFRVYAVTALIMAPCFYVGAKLFGLNGVFGTWIFVYPVVLLLPLAIALRNEIGLRISDFILNARAPLFAAVAMASTVWVVRTSLDLHLSPIIRLGASVGLGAVVYSLIVFTLFRQSFQSAIRLR